MPRRSLFYTVILAATLAPGLVALDAQQPATNPPAANRTTSTRISGISIPDVAGVPFSATVVIESDWDLPDGSVLTRRTINLIDCHVTPCSCPRPTRPGPMNFSRILF